MDPKELEDAAARRKRALQLCDEISALAEHCRVFTSYEPLLRELRSLAREPFRDMDEFLSELDHALRGFCGRKREGKTSDDYLSELGLALHKLRGWSGFGVDPKKWEHGAPR